MLIQLLKMLSIHAPTRGATRWLNIFSCVIIFFQSTLLQEERPDEKCHRQRNASFNPRSYKRSDITFVYADSLHLAFNPRSYKRSDLCFEKNINFINSFNPRSYKRSDTYLLRYVNITTLSIHAPTRGATRIILH